MGTESSFLTNILKLSSASVIAQGLAVITAPIFSRLFSPEHVGILSMFSSISAVIVILSTLRLDQALILPKEDKVAINIFTATVIIATLFSLSMYLLYFLGVENFFHGTKFEALNDLLWLFPVVTLLQGNLLALNSWLSRKKCFGFNASMKVANSVYTRIGNIGGGFLGYKTGDYLIFVIVSMTAIEFFAKYLYFLKNFYYLLRSFSPKNVYRGVLRYIKFPLIDTWGALISVFSIHLSPLLIAFFFSTKEVGYYAQSLRLIQLPMILLGSAISQVYYQKASEMENYNQLGSLMNQIHRILIYIGALPFLILLLFGEELFLFLLGEPWIESGIYSQILSPWCFIMFCVSPVATSVFVIEKQSFFLLINFVTLLLRLSSFYIGFHMGSCRIALLLFSISGVLLYAVFQSYLFKKTNLPVLKTWFSNIVQITPILLSSIPLLLIKLHIESAQYRLLTVSLFCIVLLPLVYKKLLKEKNKIIAS